MSGSEQFLGQQLTRQAEALQELVVKMTESTMYLQSSVPKFAKVSENTMKVVEVNYTGTNQVGTMSTFSTFMSGRIKIKVIGKGTNATTGFGLDIYINGVNKGTTTDLKGTVVGEAIAEIDILENDSLQFRIRAVGTTGATVTVTSINLCYELVAKPDISI